MRGIVTFGVVGGIVTVCHIVTGLFIDYTLGFSAFFSNLVAYMVGFLLGYFGHRNFSFRSKTQIRRSMPRFFAISLNNLIVNQLIVYVVVNAAGYSYKVSLYVMVVVVPILTYALSKVWAFADGESS